MKPGLTELAAVLAVARQRNFRAAADELGMSRAALSHAVSALERRIGVRLFNRTTRSVSLTEAGEQFVASVSPALKQIELAVMAATSRQGRLVAAGRWGAILREPDQQPCDAKEHQRRSDAFVSA
jgi:DNA-binding transcriptional LysR family regulator